LDILKLYGFSQSADIKDLDKVRELMQKDKKKSCGKLKFVLPEGIGSVIRTHDVSDDEINAALEFICGDWLVGKE